MASVMKFSEEVSSCVRDRISTLSSRALYGRMIGFSGMLREWLIASQAIQDRWIEDITLLGRGAFMVVLSSETCSSSLLARSPLSLGANRLILSVPWYPGFDLAGFESRCQVPRFQVKCAFPGLPPEFIIQEVLEQFGSIFGVHFGSSASLKSPAPSIRVDVSSTEFPEEISYEWEGATRSQRIIVTGRPN